MKKTFTENDVISYLYGESVSEISESVESQLILDDVFQEQVIGMGQVKQLIDEMEITVPKDLQSKILEKISVLEHLSV